MRPLLLSGLIALACLQSPKAGLLAPAYHAAAAGLNPNRLNLQYRFNPGSVRPGDSLAAGALYLPLGQGRLSLLGRVQYTPGGSLRLPLQNAYYMRAFGHYDIAAGLAFDYRDSAYAGAEAGYCAERVFGSEPCLAEEKGAARRNHHTREWEWRASLDGARRLKAGLSLLGALSLRQTWRKGYEYREFLRDQVTPGEWYGSGNYRDFNQQDADFELSARAGLLQTGRRRKAFSPPRDDADSASRPARGRARLLDFSYRLAVSRFEPRVTDGFLTWYRPETNLWVQTLNFEGRRDIVNEFRFMLAFGDPNPDLAFRGPSLFGSRFKIRWIVHELAVETGARTLHSRGATVTRWEREGVLDWTVSDKSGRQFQLGLDLRSRQDISFFDLLFVGEALDGVSQCQFFEGYQTVDTRVTLDALAGLRRVFRGRFLAEAGVALQGISFESNLVSDDINSSTPSVTTPSFHQAYLRLGLLR